MGLTLNFWIVCMFSLRRDNQINLTAGEILHPEILRVQVVYMHQDSLRDNRLHFVLRDYR